MMFEFGDVVKASGMDACKHWSSYRPFEHLTVICVSKHCLVAANSNSDTFVGGFACFELVKRAVKNG